MLSTVNFSLTNTATGRHCVAVNQVFRYAVVLQPDVHGPVQGAIQQNCIPRLRHRFGKLQRHLPLGPRRHGRDGVQMGNSIANQSSWTADGRINFETLYNKFTLLKDINKRFANTRSAPQTNRKAKKFERTFKLKPDTTLVIKHNLRTKKIKVTAQTIDGKPFMVKTRLSTPTTSKCLIEASKM